MTDTNYILKKPFSYAYKGDMQNAEFITLKEPSYKQIDKVALIKQDFMTAIEHMQSSSLNAIQSIDVQDSLTIIQDDEDPQAESKELSITAKEAMQSLYMSPVKMDAFFVRCQELFRSGVALVDGETKLTMPMIEKMSIDDFELMSGKYIVNFILPSLTDGMEEST